MNINRIQTRFKRLGSLILGIILIVTLSSCSSSTFEGADDIYAKNSNYTVTYAELWEELKWEASDYVEEAKEEVILASYLEDIKTVIAGSDSDTKEQYYEFLEYFARIEIFNRSEESAVESLSTKQVETYVTTYIDNYYLEYNKDITEEEIFTTTTVNGEEFKYCGIYDTVYLDVAKQLFGIDALKEEIAEYEEDEEEDYYSDSDIINLYDSTYLHETDGKAVVIRFTHDDEMASTLKAFGIKVINDQFYYLPEDGTMTDGQYSTYYDNFDATLSSNFEKLVNLNSIGGDAAIFQLYVEIYNYIYPYRTPLTSIVTNPTTTNNKKSHTLEIINYYKNNNEVIDPSEIVASWDQTKQDIIYYDDETYDYMTTLFINYLFDFLQEDPADDEDRYATEGQTFDGYSYIVFKVEQTPLDDDMVLYDDNEEIINEELKLQVIEDLIVNEANSVYYTAALTEEKEDELKVKIYDEAVEISYAANNDDYSKTYGSAPEDGVLFSVKYNDETFYYYFDDIFDQLIEDGGPTTAIEILSTKEIKDSDYYKDITDEEVEDFEEELDYVLSAFAADQYSTYPASLGKYNFLMLYYGSSDIDEIIDDYYKVSYASQKILTDYTNNDELLELFQYYAEIAYNNAFNVTGSNILIYVDMDEDGDPDQDFDWDTVAENGLTYTENVDNLLSEIWYILDNIDPSIGESTALSNIVSEYEVASRFTNYVGDEETGTAIDQWSQYKKLGIYIQLTEFSNVTNTTSEDSSIEGYVTSEFKSRVNYLYTETDIIINDQAQAVYVDQEKYSTVEGWNFILFSSIETQTSAEFDRGDDLLGLYENIVTLFNGEYVVVENVYNSDTILSTNQIELFIYEYLTSSTTNLFPTEILDAVTTYFQPVFERYNDGVTQTLLLLDIIGDLEFTDESELIRFERYMEIKEVQADGYLESGDVAFNFDGWWDAIIALGGSN